MTRMGASGPEAYQLVTPLTGFVSRSGGGIWAVNTTGRVVVPALGIDETMWVYAREFTADEQGGEAVKLTWLPLGALTLGGST